MKREREFIEVSDDEWSLHSDSFKPSRVLNPPQSNLPPIESFTYTNNNSSISNNSGSNKNQNYNPNCINDSICILDSSSSEEGNQNVAMEADNLEDEDAYLEFGLDDFDDGSDFSGFEEEEENLEEDDVIKKALRKCGKISAELKKELYGTSAAQFDHYSEVEEASAVKIVTQGDVNEACGADHSDPMLKPYQLVGVNFLLLLYRKKIAGAILADEMGLGKTVQAITYLALLKHLEDDPGPHLIVSYSKELSSLSKAGLPPPFNVILVCYSLFERHSAQQKDDRKILKRWRWSCVIMDEAHALKDKNSYRWKNLMTVARNANQRLMLTGTPLQNDLHELWSMLEFMMPDLFETGDVDLRKLLNAEDMDLIARMKSILGPFILRRLKSNVMQQLVPKMHMIEYVHMERAQEDAYKEAIENYRAASETRIAKSSGMNSNSVTSVLPRRQISNYFLQFRKIANHPLLVRRIFTDDDVVCFAKMLHPKGVFGFECTLERVIEELKSYNDFSIHRLLLYYGDTGMKGMLSDEHVMISAKCRALAEFLPKLKLSGHRVLIFSQWTSMLDILEWTLDVIGVTYRRLDGSTQVTERQTIVDTFNKDASIFACLLSTDRPEDRCHRIGQTKPVTVYRLVTKDTVDENVYEIAKRKLTLDAAVLESGAEADNEGQMPDKSMAEILSSLLLH
ncbi:Protein CHROMATIN REMODELING 19 [Abeliophyllum distichum]|uniref:Protein CHROMATIN REMODELING 19 n=1 Tax=Abeliophyllum distichum TaxID=126358 RepID=A0ABD1VVA8_9LAMI